MAEPSQPSSSTTVSGASGAARRPWWARVFGLLFTERGFDEGWALAGPWDESALRVIKAAFALSRLRSTRRVECVHVLAALLDEETLTGHWRASAGELDALRLSSIDAVDALAGASPITVAGEPLRTLLRVIAWTGQETGRTSLSAVDLLLYIGHFDEIVRDLLAQHEVSRARIARYVAHGLAELPRATDESAPPGDELVLVLHNDDYTPQNVVSELLIALFAMASAEAHVVMMTVHNEGEAFVDVLPRLLAIDAVNALLDAAEERDVPLRASLRKLDGA